MSGRRGADALLKEDVRSGRIEPVRLDVRDRTAIESARAYVEARTTGQGLHALVNNAGLAVIQPIEFASEEDLAHQLGVNLVGPIRLIQAFLPEQG